MSPTTCAPRPKAEAVYEVDRFHPWRLALPHSRLRRSHSCAARPARGALVRQGRAGGLAWQHMPSHIFFALGMWGRTRSRRTPASLATARAHGDGGYHSRDLAGLCVFAGGPAPGCRAADTLRRRTTSAGATKDNRIRLPTHAPCGSWRPSRRWSRRPLASQQRRHCVNRYFARQRLCARDHASAIGDPAEARVSLAQRRARIMRARRRARLQRPIRTAW